MEACVRTLERCSRTHADLGEIVRNSVPVLLGTSQMSTHLLVPPCRDKTHGPCVPFEQYVDYVNQCGGIETITMLSNKSDNAQIVKQGGRLLSKIAKSRLTETMANLQNSNLSHDVKMTTLNLLSSLALEDESAEKIVANGGIGTLLADLASYEVDEGMIIAESKFLGRLMTSSKNVSEMIQNNGVDTILGLAARSGGNEAIMESVMPTLVQMISMSENPDNIVSSDGVSGIKTVINTVSSTPGFVASTESGVKLIAKLVTSKKRDNKPQIIQVRQFETMKSNCSFLHMFASFNLCNHLLISS